MLIDNLQKTVKQLKQLDILETAVQDAERKAKNDSDYSALVSDLWISMKTLSYANIELDFIPTTEMVQLATDMINKLENIISSGAVDEEEMADTKQQINRRLVPGFAKEWKAYHQKKTSSVVAKMETIGSLVQDQSKITSIRTNLTSSSDWEGLLYKGNGTDTRLELLKAGIDEIDQIEEKLDLSPEIKQFVVNVTRGRAKVTDITPAIISWINKVDLQDKFIISFRKS